MPLLKLQSQLPPDQELEPEVGVQDNESPWPLRAPLADNRIKLLGLLAEVSRNLHDIFFEGAPARFKPIMGIPDLPI